MSRCFSPRRRFIGWLLAAACLTVASARAATSEQIDAAVARLKEHLYTTQKDGTWETVAKRQDGGIGNLTTGLQWGGQTALATYALLAAGEKPTDPRLEPAIKFLKTSEIVGTYALAMRCQVWFNLPRTPDVKELFTRDVQTLVKGMKTKGDAAGMYSYDARDPGGLAYSHSRSQYAVLGVWAGAQAGIEIPPAFWTKAEKAWVDHQDPTGGWNYTYRHPTHPLTPGMTAAGVVSLMIIGDQLYGNAGITCLPSPPNPAIDKGLQWLADHVDQYATDDKFPRSYPYTTMYTVERVAAASGLKSIGTVDWYQKGADFILRTQNKNGSFSRSGGEEITGNVDTCMALLFLARGRAPVALNKLHYGTAPATPSAKARGPGATVVAAAAKPPSDAANNNWNLRPRDAANLSRWIGRELEQHFNYQIVTLDGPVEDLHDSPVLYISGKLAPVFTPEQEAKLRVFVEQGGLILGNADCNSDAFTTGFRKLGSRLFNTYEFRTLPANHVIFTGGPFPKGRWKTSIPVQGLSNGVRELMLLPGQDLGRYWQTQTLGGREEFHQLAADILLYPVDKQNLLKRGETYLIAPDATVAAKRTMKLARLEYSGNWDPEPYGWKRLAALLHNNDGLDLEIAQVPLARGALTGYNIAHLTGTTRLVLTDDQKQELKQFVTGGGMLIVDAAGGSSEFAATAEPLLNQVLGQTITAAPLPETHALFATAGPALPKAVYRAFAKSVVGNLKTPRLRGMEMNSRLAVIFSPEDLTAGLVGQPVDGIYGYTPATATALMERIMLFAAQ